MNVVIDGVTYVPMPPQVAGGNMLSALDIRFDSDAGECITIRDYLRILLTTLWEEQESFSGKRPFGNSSWAFDLYVPLIERGYITGTLDEDGYVETYNKAEAWTYINNLIMVAFYGI